MRAYYLILIFLLVKVAQLDIGGVPGTSNQIEKDPAQESFEQEYDELEQVMKELDGPQDEPEKEEARPTHERQDEPVENRVEE